MAALPKETMNDKYKALRNAENIASTELVGEDMIGKVIEVAGIKITVQTDAECDKADWWVCVRKNENYPQSPLATAVVGECSKCQHPIWYNPRASLTGPKKICVECMLGVANGEETLNE